jgi:putative ABC transport system permease protein
MLYDLRYALRSFRANPGFTLAAILTLALGIGANTAIFTVIYGVLLKPLPYGEPDRLVQIRELKGSLLWNVSYPNYVDWRARSHAFDGMAIYTAFETSTLSSPGMPAGIYPAGHCETTLFRVMGIPAALGRVFENGDRVKGAPVGVVITDALWHKRFGGDPGVVGGLITIDEGRATLLGVLPPAVRPFDVDLWYPTRDYSPMQLDRANHPGFQVVARLRAGVDIDAAQREMSSIAASLAREYPASNRTMGVRVRPMIDAVAGSIRPTLNMLAGAVAVLLLIACANVANLLLAKGFRRERETSVRSALGASRGRLIRLFLIEGLTLGACGAVAGLLLAGWSVRLLRSVPGFTLPRATDVTIDPHVLGFAIALGLVTAAIFALAPAVQLSRVELMNVLRLAGAAELPRHARLRSLLVAVEVALLIVLLAGAVLMQRTLANLSGVNAGFDASRILAAPVQLGASYGNDEAVRLFSDRLLASFDGAHGFAGAALSWPFDYVGPSWAPSINIPDHPFEAGREPSVFTAAVTPGYFKTMGIPIERGRTFTASDRPGAPMGVIVNQTFADRFFPGEDPLGRRVNAMRIPQMQNMPIIGVAGDTRRSGMLGGFTPEMYVAYAQFPQAGATLVLRSADDDPLSLTPDVTARVAALDPNVVVKSTQRVSDALARSYGDRRALSWLLSVFAGLALGLTVLGIAGVVSFTVAQRTSEIGIRIALGANRAGVVRLIVAGAMGPVAVGAVVGLLALLPLSRVMHSYLFGVSAADPLSLAAACALLGAAAVFAAYVPARRAASIDPMRALRA